jgi:D-amino-acid dehydrogenase
MQITIVGGGVIGLFSAWHLAKAGHEVSVVDKGDFSDNCSFGNAGMVTPSHFVPLAAPGVVAQGLRWMFKADSPFYIRPRLNVELMQWLWRFYRSCNARQAEAAMPILLDFNLLGKKGYLEFEKETGLDFKLRKEGILMLYKDAHVEKEELEMAEKASALGLEPKVLTATEVAEFEKGVELYVRGGVFYPADAYMYPNILMKLLKEKLGEKGVRFYPNTEIAGFELKGNKIGALKSSSQYFEADAFLIAAGSWTGKLLKKAGIHLPLQDGKGYSVTLTKPAHRPQHACILVEARVAVTPMGDDLRFAGTLELSGLAAGVNRRRVQAILDSIPQYFPKFDMPQTDPGNAWYGYRPCTPDGLPYVGYLRKYENLMVATGHAMMGLSLGPATGMLVEQLVAGNPDERYAKFFDPNRYL